MQRMIGFAENAEGLRRFLDNGLRSNGIAVTGTAAPLAEYAAQPDLRQIGNGNPSFKIAVVQWARGKNERRPRWTVARKDRFRIPLESRKVFATLVRVLGDFDLAEDALHDAFIAALAQWPQEGLPKNPYSWLVSAGRYKAIDALRRQARFNALLGDLAERLDTVHKDEHPWEEEGVEDDRFGNLHLLPPCPIPGGSHRADAAGGVRADDGGDRPRLPDLPSHCRTADRPRQSENPRRPHSLPGAFVCRSA